MIELPAAYLSYKAASKCVPQDVGRLSGPLTIFVEGRAQVALERERRLTIELALQQLPPGACLLVRDAHGREWYSGPACRTVAHELREVA